MKRVRAGALACLVAGCMPVHDVALGSDGREVALPDAATVTDSATVDVDVTDARSHDHDDVDAAPLDGAPPDAARRDDDVDDRPSSAGPQLRDAALGGGDADLSDASDGAAVDGATRRDAATDGATRDDDDDRRDAGPTRDSDDSP